MSCVRCCLSCVASVKRRSDYEPVKLAEELVERHDAGVVRDEMYRDEGSNGGDDIESNGGGSHGGSADWHLDEDDDGQFEYHAERVQLYDGRDGSVETDGEGSNGADVGCPASNPAPYREFEAADSVGEGGNGADVGRPASNPAADRDGPWWENRRLKEDKTELHAGGNARGRRSGERRGGGAGDAERDKVYDGKGDGGAETDSGGSSGADVGRAASYPAPSFNHQNNALGTIAEDSMNPLMAADLQPNPEAVAMEPHHLASQVLRAPLGEAPLAPLAPLLQPGGSYSGPSGSGSNRKKLSKDANPKAIVW